MAARRRSDRGPGQPGRCAWLLAGALAACAVGPDYRRPPLDLPSDFRGTPPAARATAELRWWEIFHDPHLQALIREALAHNYDVRIAITRVEQARQVLAQARAGFFPQITYDGYVAHGKNVTGTSIPSPTGVGGMVYAFSGSASWELDVWGRIRRMSESAQAQLHASEEAERDVTIVLLAEVAQGYFQLLALDRQVEIATQTRQAFAATLRIFSERLQGGVASKLETASAEALLGSAAASIPNLERQVVVQENALCVLLGRNPGPIARGSFDGQVVSQIPAGLPSRLLERRPDVRQAEQNLHAANAQIGVAKADFFPQLSLTGLLGQVSVQLSSLFTSGATAWVAAAGAGGPLFTGGAVTARFRQAKAVRDQLALQYQATVLQALREVSDSLIARQKFAEVNVEQTRAVAANQEAVHIALDRYVQGNASYYEVLQQQQQLFPAQLSLIQARLSELLTVVQLYLALGGGW